MGLCFFYKDSEQFYKAVAEKKIRKDIYGFLSELKDSNNCLSDRGAPLTEENIYDCFELTVDDQFFSSESLKNPTEGSFSKIMHDEIIVSYEQYMMESHIKEALIHFDMNELEAFHLVNNIIPYENLTKGYYMDRLMKDLEITYDDARSLYEISSDMMSGNENEFSMDEIIDTISSNIKRKAIKLEEFIELSPDEVREGLCIKNFNQYSILVTNPIVPIGLNELLNMDEPDYSVLYELSDNDLTEFVNMWCDGKNPPQVRVFHDCAAFDNTDGECFGEEFDTCEKALKWLAGLSVEETEELFARYKFNEDIGLEM